KDFAEVPQRLQEGTMINLNDPDPGSRMQLLLQKGYYFEDPKDIALISSMVTKGMQGAGTIDNIGELNKNRFSLEADQAYAAGGLTFKKRVQLSRSLLGYVNDDSLRFLQERSAPPPYPAAAVIGMGDRKIEGSIHNREGAAVAGILVRLQMILPQDSASGGAVVEPEKRTVERSGSWTKTYVLDSAGHRQLIALTAWARTDGNGSFSFQQLQPGSTYEVLPLQPGFQFGASQGISELKEDLSLRFLQSVHRIRLFSTRDFNILKKERSLIVRTPEAFMTWYWIIASVLLAGFLLVHLVLSVRFSQADQFVLPVIMLLTGISFITLLSLQDPLRDRFLAQNMLIYYGIGIILLLALQFINLKKFTTDSAFFRLILFKAQPKAANGWPWAVVAVGLLILTILFGSGPEGSGVKVNLFGFQPSEIVKFVLLIFLAGFFATNEQFISEYRRWNKRWPFFILAVAAIVGAILLFLILGDLGPAMVVCFTFIILFSYSRGDFLFMAGTVLVYVLAAWFLKNIWLATGIALGVVVLMMLFLRRQLSEASVMALVVIAGFLLLDQVPGLHQLFPGPVQRLTERKAIWQDAWNNEVYGGDQVANGIWAMSSGGITGQGVGEGFAKTIPEAHTDMILPSIGEEFGWMGIVGIFILFLVYLHRSILIGRQTGRSFLFYCCAGIGISTFVQFLLIAGGSTGALPLSGVALPFISYGGSSLVANMLAAGFLLSASQWRGSAVQMSYITERQDRNLVPSLVAACIGILLLVVNVSQYLFNNEKWVVQPALVADRSGARMFSYNPRLAILMNKLQAGSLYDRKGRILATSKPELIRQQRDSLMKSGAGSYNLEADVHKRLDRYYPFQENLFFWLGDANTGIFNGSTNGYFAEYEHGAELRGFHTPTVNFTVTASNFREDRFLPGVQREMVVSRKDYSELAPLLLAGINSQAVEQFKKRNRDVQLTLDASLQTQLQQSLAKDDSLRDNRVSVVIMDAGNGDVLASALYPLPAVNNWEQLTMSPAEQNRQNGWITNSDLGFTYATQPGSTAKIVTTLAAFNKLGLAAAQRKFMVRTDERIRTKGLEPDETGWIDLERALVKSNNVYFIKLANEAHLQEEMARLYMQTGMFLKGVGGYLYARDEVSEEQKDKWMNYWRKTEFNTRPRYNPNNIRLTRAKGISGMAWGQGELIATPAAVARLAAGVANGGMLVPNRFVLKISDSALGVQKGTRIVTDPAYAQLTQGYMIKQSANKTQRLGVKVAGKTGTPERIVKGERVNDGWYVFFAPKPQGGGHLVVCIRIESTKGSSDAVKLAGDHVVPLLLQKGYIKSFETEGEPAPAGPAEEQRITRE
ncbi:MAG TPA: FtsW/RodA/SpoVE family cell cycle protein, partial [Flavisolibacter sp.]|nr:FtsW/RodA/SpoVE family cell cycle protein [Flavisolibacter sp.]